MSFWKSKDFKALSKEWEKKLKESGFNDAETTTQSDERILKQRASNSYHQQKIITREAKLRYYEILSHHTQNYNFTSERDRLIMQRASEGLKAPQIIQSLPKPVHRHTIKYIIRRYEHLWKIRKYTHKQMNLKTPTRSFNMQEDDCQHNTDL